MEDINKLNSGSRKNRANRGSLYAFIFCVEIWLTLAAVTNGLSPFYAKGIVLFKMGAVIILLQIIFYFLFMKDKKYDFLRIIFWILFIFLLSSHYLYDLIPKETRDKIQMKYTPNSGVL